MSANFEFKNSAQKDKEVSPNQIQFGEIALNYHQTGPFLQCKDTSGRVWRIGGIIVDENAPASPAIGAWWHKPSNQHTSFFNGSNWIRVSQGSIVDSDIALGANIEVSKLAPGAPGQLIQTHPSGTLVEWVSSLDVPGTLTVNSDTVLNADTVIHGDLTVDGTVTTINTVDLSIKDKNIELGVVPTPSDAAADTGGITLKGTTDKTFNWINLTQSWTSSENLNLAFGKTYKISGIDVLSGTSLGSGVVNSSLTSVGTIGTGVWQGSAIGAAYGGTGQTSYSAGQLLIGRTDGTLGKSTLTAGSNITITNGNGTIQIAATDTNTTYTAGDGLDLTGTVFSVDLKAGSGLVIESGEIALDADLTAIAGLTGTSGFLKKTAANTWSLDTNTYLTGNQNITISGDAAGSGTTSIALTLANSGVTAGTYNNSSTAITPLTVDAKGRITGVGSSVTITPAFTSITGKPTTLAGYGITDGVSTSGDQSIAGNKSFTGITTLAGTAAGSWGASNTDIDGLIGGSAFGSLFEGVSNGHFTVGLRSNDVGDGFQVISKQSGNATYTLKCFEVRADGDASIAGTLTAAGFSGNATTATTLATARTIWGQSFNGSANISGNLTAVGNITGSGAVVLASGGTNQNVTINTSGTGSIILDTGTAGGTVQLKGGANGTRIYNAANTQFSQINAEALSATRTLTLANADTTLVGGTMVPTTGSGATGTWGISITGSSASCTGNAATATTLQTTRTIWGQNFNGSGNVTGALSGATTIAASSDISLGGELNFTTASNKFIDFYTDNDAGTLSYVAFRLVNNASNSFNNGIVMQRGGAVSLYHNNSLKLATSASGADVTGTLTATTFSGSGASLTSLNASNISSGTIGDAYLPASISSDITGNAATATIVNRTVTGTNSADLVYGNMADNDQFRIRIGGTASNAGFVEIATADDGTEPIHVRQYNGVFSTLVRTATLLDGSGNTSFPGTVSATTFSGSGASLTSLNASNLSSGTVPDARISGSYTGLTNLTGSGTFTAATFTGTSANQALFHPGGSVPTVIHRNDGGSYYVLLSAAGTSPSATWNTLRPFQINCSTGVLSSANGQELSGFTRIFGVSQANGVNGLSIYNTSTWSGMSIVGSSTKMLGMHYGGGSNQLRLGRYAKPADASSGANWEANPFTFDLDNGNFTASGAVIGNQLTSTVATGTAPLTVSSTTAVTNLNADLVDGIQGSQLLRADEYDEYAGNVAGRRIRFRMVDSQNGGSSSGDLAPLEVYQNVNATNSDAFMTFHISGRYARYFGMDRETNDLFTGGWSAGAAKQRIWHQGNTSSAVWASTGAINAVVGMLAWKNFGNNHVIFDASSGISPSGTAVNNTNSNAVWSSTRPTLMGWNGTDTYGVRVDSARVVDNGVYTTGTQTIGGDKTFSSTVTAPTFNATSTANGGFQGIDADSAANPSFTWSGDLDTGMYRIGANQIGFTLGGFGAIDLQSNQINIAAADIPNGGFRRYFANGTVSGANARYAWIGVYKHAGIASGCGAIGLEQQDGGDSVIWVDDSNNVRTSTTTDHIGTTNGTVIGTQTSDERLKNILGPIAYGLNEIKQLSPVRYALKTEPDKDCLGFIAQQVLPIIPESVFDTKEILEGYPEDETKLGMEYVALIPVLVNAIKELADEIEMLKTK